MFINDNWKFFLKRYWICSRFQLNIRVEVCPEPRAIFELLIGEKVFNREEKVELEVAVLWYIFENSFDGIVTTFPFRSKCEGLVDRIVVPEIFFSGRFRDDYR